MKNKRKFNKYVINLLLTTVFGGVIGLINYMFNIFIARFTPENIFGLYSTAIGAVYLIQIPALSIQNILTKAVGENKKGDINKLKSSSVITLGVVGISLAFLFYSLSSLFTENMELTVKTVFPLSITLLFAFISPISKGILLGKERIVLLNVILFIETLLKFAIGYLAIKLNGSLTLLILANAVPAFLSFLVVIPFLKSPKSYKKTIEISYKEILLMTVSLLLLSAPYTLDLILVPFELKASYGALSLIGKIVYFAAITIASVMFARLSNQKGKKRDLHTLSITVLVTFVIGTIGSLGLYLFKDFIQELAFGGRYTEISVYFILFGLIMTAYAIVYIMANFFFVRNSYSYIVILVLVAVVQVALFKFRTSDLYSVVCNQFFVYTLLLISTFIYFIFKFLVNRDGKKTKKGS